MGSTITRESRVSVVSKWSHAICLPCWVVREGDRNPVHLTDPTVVDCCFCGNRTGAGIYVRHDPQETLHCTHDLDVVETDLDRHLAGTHKIEMVNVDLTPEVIHKLCHSEKNDIHVPDHTHNE